MSNAMKSIRGTVLFLLLVVLISFGISPAATADGGEIWTSRTSPADNSWRSVTYGNGLFVAVSYTGTGNRVMTSPDGVTWTSRTSAADNDWRNVIYGNGLFVAVAFSGTGNRVMTSPDGITWTSRTSAADNSWWGVTYGNGLFVAVATSGTGNRVMTSPDGITWTSRTSAADNSWYYVTYGNGLFVAVAFSGTGNRVMTSPDGITWTSRTSAADNGWTSVTYGNGLFVAVSNSGTGNRVMTSPSTIVPDAPVYVPPMLPSFAPSIAVNNGVITCTIGEYSRAATSVVFSLFVDGNHLATNFSATGDYLPSWLAPWASASTVQRSATLQSASWNIAIAGDASRASCWTLAYSNNATGLISSNSISLHLD